MHKITIDFRIIGFDFHPVILTEKLDIEPTKIFVKGEPLNPSLNKKLLNKNNIWVLSSGKSEDLPLDQHVESLEKIINSKIDLFVEISNRYMSEFSVVLYLDSETDESVPPVHFEKEFNSLAGILNASIDVDIYIL